VTAAGRGRTLGYRWGAASLRNPATVVYGGELEVANNYFWAAGLASAPAVVEIPLCWLTPPVTLRLNQPVNYVSVTSSTGEDIRAINRESVAQYGVFDASHQLETDEYGAAANLGNWIVAYHGEPRVSSPTLTMMLHPARTDTERHQILAVEIGQRVRIVDVPAAYPEGAADLIVTGIHDALSTFGRIRQWTTEQVVGAVPGESGPWFVWDSSSWDGSDVRLY
jgi:hypothetical protein